MPPPATTSIDSYRTRLTECEWKSCTNRFMSLCLCMMIVYLAEQVEKVSPIYIVVVHSHLQITHVPGPRPPSQDMEEDARE